MKKSNASTSYKKTFLTQVIVRIDYLNTIDSILTGLPKPLSQKALRLFPIAEPREVIAQELQITPKAVESARTIKGKEWHFFGKNREKYLVIGNKAMFINYSIYESFEKLQGDFSSMLDPLLATFEDLEISRLGLRYINNVELSESDYTNWSPYLNKKLLTIFNVADDVSKISRAFNVLELNYGDMNLTFQYGMHNPDWPAVIRRKLFVLDFDAYFQGLIQSKEEVSAYLIRFHDKIQELFESSITAKLRGLMDGKQ